MDLFHDDDDCSQAEESAAQSLTLWQMVEPGGGRLNSLYTSHIQTVRCEVGCCKSDVVRLFELAKTQC